MQYETSKQSVYGYCPLCNSPGITRERRPNGNDECAQGHLYSSRLAVKKIITKQLPQDIIEAIEDYVDAYSTARIAKVLYDMYPGKEVEITYERLAQVILSKIS